MTKKCLSSFITFIFFSAVCFISMHLMLLTDVNKYVGVGIGSGILVIAFVSYLIFRENRKLKGWIFLFLIASAIGSGLAISSLYVYLGKAPAMIHSFCIWITYTILFLIYCLFVNIPLFKHFPRICLAVYGLIVLAGGIAGIIFSSKIIFSLALMMFVLFMSYLATILARSCNYSEHHKSLAWASFIGLFLVVIIVFIVISDGNGLDGIDDFGTGDNYRDPKKNPYEFDVI